MILTTRYFDEQVLRKRPYLTLKLCEEALENIVKAEIQEDARIKVWCKIYDKTAQKVRYLRIILLEDGKTVHNAFYDMDYKQDETPLLP